MYVKAIENLSIILIIQLATTYENLWSRIDWNNQMCQGLPRDLKWDKKLPKCSLKVSDEEVHWLLPMLIFKWFKSSLTYYFFSIAFTSWG